MIGILEVIKVIVLGSFLLLEGIRDWRKRRISIKTVLVTGILGTLIQFSSIRENGLEMMGGMLVGAVFLILARVTKERIGYGDGWVLVVSGMYLGFRNNMYLLMLSLFLVSLVSIFLLLIKKADRKTELPFVSFMLPSYLLLFAII